MKNQMIWSLIVVLAFFGAACTKRSGPGPKQSDTALGNKSEASAHDDSSAEVSMPKASVEYDVLKKKVERYAPTRIGFDAARLPKHEREAIKILVDASRIMDDLFWEQASPSGQELRQKLAQAGSKEEKLLDQYVRINYGAYDRLDEMALFIADDKLGPKPKGATFYPLDMTKDEFLKHLEKNPGDTKAFQSNFTVIRRTEGKLTAVPYSVHYAEKLKKAAQLLNQAADLVKNESLAKYLRSRAASFSSNDYFQSDMDWMDVADSNIEVTIGPYEVYEDGLFNYKAAFESFVTVRDDAESKKLSTVAGHLVDMEKNLPIPEEHKNFNRGLSSPIMAVDLVYSAGDTRAGIQTLAFNLPNDERVREKKGCKKVMLKNISHAKFDKILTPIAGRALAEEQLDRLTFDAYFNHTLMHEMSHGLGPGTIEKDGQKTTVNLMLKELYSTIEEAKADVLGVFNTLYMVEKGVFDKSLREQAMITFLAGVFRSVRFGVHEAHGQANVVAFNYLLENGAYKFDDATKKFSVDLAKAPKVFESLAKELLMIEALGDYEAAKKFIEEHGHVKPQMQAVLDGLTDIPVDIFPIFEVE